jgi:hypothetical protein
MGIDLVSLLIGYCSALGTVAFGSVLSRAKARRNAALPSVARCSCGHTIAYHHADTQQCHIQLCTSRFDNTWEQCSCQRYDGPTPIEDFFARPLPELGKQ